MLVGVHRCAGRRIVQAGGAGSAVGTDRSQTMSDKGKGSKTTKKAPKAGKHGLRPHEVREQADPAPAVKKIGK
jgi:hypothetical protein